jgi:hypothetical protein
MKNLYFGDENQNLIMPYNINIGFAKKHARFP